VADRIVKEFFWDASLLELYLKFYPQRDNFFLYSALSPARFSYLGCNPHMIFSSKRDQITVSSRQETEQFQGNPFDVFYRLLQSSPWHVPVGENTLGESCFFGGAVGYWGYDLKDHLEVLPSSAEDDLDLPDSYWMFCDGLVVIDHEQGRKYLIGDSAAIAELEEIIHSDAVYSHEGGFDFALGASVSKNDYLKNISKIRKFIAAGDTYEINLSQRFHIDFTKRTARTDFDIFRSLTEVSPSPFSAILKCGDFSVISSSPERFLKVSHGMCESKPIKGTRPRHNDFHEDERRFLDLYFSEKDRAENLMIVDLVRNDLGRVSQAGSVCVENIFDIEKYATVFQMVSTISSKLDKGRTVMDAVKSCFPPGSMTGAPKIRAMQIIEELEGFKRGIYSGALGYIGKTGDLDLSVIIRTLIVRGNKAYFQTGGAIVWDSIAEAEYQECWDKAQGILRALDNLRSI
jgi:para-aminobenzoate synthetase component 1